MRIAVLRRPPLHQTVVENLRSRLHQALASGEQRMPSETALASELGVSRQTIREALRILEGEGLVNRRRGLGSFITPTPQVETGIQSLDRFWDTIQSAGYVPSAAILRLEEATLPDPIAVGLAADPGSPGFRTDTLYRADDVPVLYSIVYIPRRHVTSMEVLEGRRRWSSMREFFQQDLQIPARYARLTLLAEGVAPELAGPLELAAGAPVLVVEGPTFGDGDDPLMFTRAVFRTDKYRFTLIRR